MGDRVNIVPLARRMIDLGFVVVPMRLDGKKPHGTWKDWQYQKTRPTAEEMIERCRDYNDVSNGVALLHGETNNTIVIDFDTKEDVDAAFAEYSDAPLRLRSGNGGHVAFRPDPTIDQTAIRQLLGGQIQLPSGRWVSMDMKPQGGYTVAPNSWHARRERLYAEVEPWTAEGMTRLPVLSGDTHIKDASGRETTIRERANEWLREKNAPPPVPYVPPVRSYSAGEWTPYQRAQAYMDRADGRSDGRKAAAFALACKLVRGFALSDGEALTLMHGWNSRNSPPLADSFIALKIRNAHKDGKEAYGEALADRPRRTSVRLAADMAPLPTCSNCNGLPAVPESNWNEPKIPRRFLHRNSRKFIRSIASAECHDKRPLHKRKRNDRHTKRVRSVGRSACDVSVCGEAMHWGDRKNAELLLHHDCPDHGERGATVLACRRRGLCPGCGTFFAGRVEAHMRDEPFFQKNGVYLIDFGIDSDAFPDPRDAHDEIVRRRTLLQRRFFSPRIWTFHSNRWVIGLWKGILITTKNGLDHFERTLKTDKKFASAFSWARCERYTTHDQRMQAARTVAEVYAEPCLLVADAADSMDGPGLTLLLDVFQRETVRRSDGSKKGATKKDENGNPIPNDSYHKPIPWFNEDEVNKAATDEAKKRGRWHDPRKCDHEVRPGVACGKDTIPSITFKGKKYTSDKYDLATLPLHKIERIAFDFAVKEERAEEALLALAG